MTPTAALFPGQGAQTVGMGADFASRPDSAVLFRRASDVLGFDLARLCAEGPAEELTRSDRAQPAIFVVSVICETALLAAHPSLKWTAAAGLSSGEWAALHSAGVLSFEDAVRVLEARGRFMQEACERTPGGMVSVIGMEPAALAALAREAGVELANFNSPEQTVLSGPKEAVAAAARLAAERGARRVIPLQVAGAFHSSLMAPAAARLEEFLGPVRFNPPSHPVISNVTGQPHDADPAAIRRRMVEQVTSPVRWVDCVTALRDLGVRRHVECGPGRVLAGLLRRIDKAAEVHTISDLPGLESVAPAL